MNSTIPLRVADAPSLAPPPPAAEKLYWTRTPDAFIDLAHTVRPRAYQVWLVLAKMFRANERKIALPSQAALAKACGCTERTVRAALAELERLGFIRRFRDRGQPWSPWMIELAFYFQGTLHLPPEQVSGPQSDRRRCTSRKSSSGTAGSDAPPVPAAMRRQRRQPVTPPLIGLEQDLEQTTTTVDCAPPPQRPAAEPPAPSSSFPPLDPIPETGPAREAPEASWSGPEARDVETPGPTGDDDVRAVLVFEAARKLFPEIPVRSLQEKLEELHGDWEDELRRRREPVARAECIAIVGLAVEYTSLMVAKDGEVRDWPYVRSQVKRWSHKGWGVEKADDDVEGLRPRRPKSAPAAEAPRAPRIPESPELGKARADLGRAYMAPAAVRDARVAEATALVVKLEAEAAAAQGEGRLPGVSASPAGGPECAAAGRTAES